MIFRKLIALLVGLCVLLAPVLGNAALPTLAPTPLPMAHADGHGADCHGLAPTGGEADHAGAQTPGTQASHGCCFNFVGLLPAADLPTPLRRGFLSGGLSGAGPSEAQRKP